MYHRFQTGRNDLNDPSTSFLAGLPTDPAALGSYLRTHVHGSSSRDEAVFVAVRDMLYGGFAPPTLRTAVLRVLENTNHVTAQGGDDPAGQPAVKVSFIDQNTRPGGVQTLYFDPDTARIVQESITAPGLTYLRTVTTTGIVTSVPSSVRHFATTSPEACIIDGSRHPDEACIQVFNPGLPEAAGPISTGLATAPTRPTK